MKLFGSKEMLIDKTKNDGNGPSLEVVEIVLIQCNLVDNHYQQKSEGLYSYASLLNVETNNLMFLKSYDTEFDDIRLTITDQNGRLLEIKNKFDVTFLTNK